MNNKIVEAAEFLAKNHPMFNGSVEEAYKHLVDQQPLTPTEVIENLGLSVWKKAEIKKNKETD